tara:strand:+ start:321 stop:839 length:519 start_codon:yes stop_codon:yes gene_type:complete
MLCATPQGRPDTPAFAFSGPQRHLHCANEQPHVDPRQLTASRALYGERPFDPSPERSMANQPITVLRDTQPMPVVDACKWERIEGDPHTVNLNAYTSEDGSKIMGTWICTPGKWRVEYVKWEYCHFQEGYCIITPDGMQPIHLKAGDIFVVEPGMKGTWEVVETVRKYFVFA